MLYARETVMHLLPPHKAMRKMWDMYLEKCTA